MSELLFPIKNELLFSPAKINTYLDVESVEPDYHSLFLNFLLLDFGDLMMFQPSYVDNPVACLESITESEFTQAREQFLQTLEIDMYAQGEVIELNKESNLIYKAIKALLESVYFPRNARTYHYLQTCQLKIQVFKRIPMQMGLGGGSSNAGTALAYLGKILCPDLPQFDELVRSFTAVGSDVPVFVYGLSGFYRGRGEVYLSQAELLEYCNTAALDVNSLNCETESRFQIERDLSFLPCAEFATQDCIPSFTRTYNLYRWQAREQLKSLGLDSSEIEKYSSHELAQLLVQAYDKLEEQRIWRKQLEKNNRKLEVEPLLISLPHLQRNDTTKIFANLRQMYNQGLINYANLKAQAYAHYSGQAGWYNVFEHYLGLQKFSEGELNSAFTLTGTGAASFVATERVLDSESSAQQVLCKFVAQPQNFDFDLIGCTPLPMLNDY